MKLSTYAAWWIKQSVKRALANQGKTIRLSVYLVNKISKMWLVSLQMSEELGREPTDDELAEEIGFARGEVSQLKTAAGKLYFLFSESCVRNAAHSRPNLAYVSTDSREIPEMGPVEAGDSTKQPAKLQKVICSVTAMHSFRRETFYRFEITEHVPRLVAGSLQGQDRLKTSCLEFGDRLNSLDCSNPIGPYR